MLISIHINKNFIHIINFTIVNSIMTYIEKNLTKSKDSDFFSNFLNDISNIFLIIFYFIEKYKSKLNSEEKGIILEKTNEKINQISPIKNIFLIISCLVFKAIYNYNIIVFDNKINDIDIFDILILFLMLLEIFIFKKKIYSHQILSMCMIFIILICSLILNYNI